MIGSFWNLCRACPSMPVDKLHSEYRSTYRWHEYTGSRQDVVRRPPQPNQISTSGDSPPCQSSVTDAELSVYGVSVTGDNQKEKLQHIQLKEEDAQNEGRKMEPAMPRRKKHPEMAYRTHEFISYDEEGSNDSGGISMRPDRARSEERAGYHLRSSRRSRSEGPPRGPPMNNISCRDEITRRRDSDPDLDTMHRGWGTELAPEHITELYNKQIELWEQVSRRSSLSALSLASTTRRSFTKEEKEEQNNKKSSPTKILNNTKNISYKKGRDSTDNSVRAVKEMIRHHLERTTGGSEYDGLILSPTREKLEPTIPKKNDEFTKNIHKDNQKSSPKKDSPQKTKRAMTKANAKPALRSIRSQSVGPANVTEKSSPKRLSRSTTLKQQKSPRESASSPPSSTIRRPRPSSLNTTAFPRSKCSTVPSKYATLEDRLSKVKTNKTLKDNCTGTTVPNSNARNQKNKQAADSVAAEKCVTIPDNEKELDGEIDVNHVIKSPPEPTRVKSPEQIIMRSPDPVNWTVPLDTGKTFTVTQNVREGELMNRPHSEVKAWTPPDVPPPAAQSAPPELAEQAKAQVWKTNEAGHTYQQQSPTPSDTDQTHFNTKANTDANTNTDIEKDTESVTVMENVLVPEVSNKSRCPEDSETESDTKDLTTVSPEMESAITEISMGSGQSCKAQEVSVPGASGRSLASEVLEKARTRFDQFWGKGKQESRNENI